YLLDQDVQPDVQLGPVREREHPYRLAGVDLRVVDGPELGPLVARVPAVVGVPEGEDPLLGAALLLVASGATKGGVEPVLRQCLLEALRLHDVRVDPRTVSEGSYALPHPVLVDVHDQFHADLART